MSRVLAPPPTLRQTLVWPHLAWCSWLWCNADAKNGRLHRREERSPTLVGDGAESRCP